MSLLITLAPGLEVTRKFVVCDHVNCFQIRNTRKVVDPPFDNRFTPNHEQRFRFVESEWIKTRCVSGGENQSIHETKIVRSKTETRSDFLRLRGASAQDCALYMPLNHLDAV